MRDCTRVKEWEGIVWVHLHYKLEIPSARVQTYIPFKTAGRCVSTKQTEHNQKRTSWWQSVGKTFWLEKFSMILESFVDSHNKDNNFFSRLRVKPENSRKNLERNQNGTNLHLSCFSFFLQISQNKTNHIYSRWAFSIDKSHTQKKILNANTGCCTIF